MIERIKSPRIILLSCLFIICQLLFDLSIKAQEVENSKLIIREIQNLPNEHDYQSNALDIVLKIIQQYHKKDYRKQPFFFYNLYRRTSVDIVVHKDSIESQLNQLHNSSDLISKFIIRPFYFSFKYARSNDQSDEANISILLFEDYKSRFVDNLSKKRGQTIHASQNNGVFETIGHQNIASFLEEALGNIDLFEETSDIMLLSFKGPLHKSNTNIYIYKLIGKELVNNQICNEIAFFCKNMKENAFAGKLYTSIEEKPRLIQAQLTFNNRESANFLKDILLVHNFGLKDSITIPTKQVSTLLIGDNLNRTIVAKRSDIFLNYNFAPPDHNLRWTINRERNYFKRDSFYWDTIRPIPLTKAQKQIDNLEQAAHKSKRFRKLERIISLALSGSYSLGGINGKVELSPLPHFVSYNKMEGARIRIGGNTTIRFSEQFQLGGYMAYGTKDSRFKHQANLVYSLSPKQKYLWEYPKEVLSFTYVSDLNIPGQDVLLMNRDHFAQSFTHAPTNNMSLQRIGLLTFESENSNNLTYKIGGKITYDRPMGVVQYMKLISPTDTTIIDNITSSDLILSLRYAPKEKFIQRKEKRTAIRRAEFELEVTYRKGFKGFFGADYGYDIINLSLFRRYNLPRNIAQIDTYISGGKIWGSVPFPLLFIPEGNQSYIFSATAYNCMNFYEFATDRFIACSINSIVNWSPFRLINSNNKIKLCLGSKIIYGPLSKRNDPAYHSELFIFNNGITPLNHTPYAEFNIGLANIFNMIRIDYSQRLTYLEGNPNANKITKGTILFSGSFSF